jgi:hypothetical protein
MQAAKLRQYASLREVFSASGAKRQELKVLTSRDNEAPQYRNARVPLASGKNLLPATSPTPPQNGNFIGISSTAQAIPVTLSPSVF